MGMVPARTAASLSIYIYIYIHIDIPQTVLTLWGSQFGLGSVAGGIKVGGRRWDPSWVLSAKTLKNLTKTSAFGQKA